MKLNCRKLTHGMCPECDRKMKEELTKGGITIEYRAAVKRL